MTRDSILTLLVLIAAVGGVALTTWMVFRAMILYRLVDAARRYPSISICLAMSSRGSSTDAESFRRWLVDTVDAHGWDETEVILEEMLSRSSLPNIDFSSVGDDET